ncbi:MULTISPECIES: hypothetical protein [unclassified Ruminococcus]|uniref:hypothetical protein n=1 Tax=unclassified Ruminococcus TaxID=2608920 RepID=UPI0021095A71|nr:MULTISPECIES: hypothetical protein [unclassified Ruminococcus]MCQ4022982.1 hypothetical protein [Ruminococcus sp. zg-924]MCQ4115320.1 hypothetical protein [Ruminococcus sp. zg-921]
MAVAKTSSPSSQTDTLSLSECAESAFSKAALCPSESAIAAFDGSRPSKVLLRYS